MKSANKIPTLSSGAYKDTYFKSGQQHETETHHSGTLSDASGHFDIQHRCIWRNDIPAHRLDFYMIFLVTSGEGIHSFGTQEHYLRKNMLCFIGPNVINSWKSDNDENKGYVCSFSEEFYGNGRIGSELLSELPFFQIDGNAVLCLSDDQMETYTQLFRMMEKENQSSHSSSPDVQLGYLHALLSKAKGDSLNSSEVIDARQTGLRIVKAFTALYMRDFNTIRKGNDIKLKRVAEYAHELGVSQNHLNDTIKEITGQSAGGLMRSQLIRQATMCLKHSSKSISEIAYRLGFEDPSYFSRFYKKQTGKLPSDYRQVIQ